MKTINYYLPTGSLTSSSGLYDGESYTSKIILNFTGMGYETYTKWIELKMGDGTVDNQNLGVVDIAEFTLTSAHLKIGNLTFQPVARFFDGTNEHIVKFSEASVKIDDALNVLTTDAQIMVDVIAYIDNSLHIKPITVNTVSPSTPASVSITQADDGLSYEFDIPKGEQGLQGIQGEIGLTGAQGIQGLQGVQGIQGNQGIQGIKGDTGEVSAAQLALKQDISSASGRLLATYVHTSNKEVFVSSVDVTTNTFTSVGHGLTNGQMIAPTLNLSAGSVYPLAVYSGGITQRVFYVISATTDTFKVSLTNGGAEVDITTNATQDLTKWHFEVATTDSIIISSLPSSYKFRLILNGKDLLNIGNVYVTPILTPSSVHANYISSLGNVYSYPMIVDRGFGAIGSLLDITIETGEIFAVTARGVVSTVSTISANAIYIINSTAFDSIRNRITPPMTDVKIFGGYIANGTKLRVYSA